jgi:hypothetical protein
MVCCIEARNPPNSRKTSPSQARNVSAASIPPADLPNISNVRSAKSQEKRGSRQRTNASVVVLVLEKCSGTGNFKRMSPVDDSP